MGRILGTLLCVGMLALAVVGVSNCYSPPNPACGFLCNAGNAFACPEGFTCSHESGVCVSNSAPMTKCYADASPTGEGLDADRTSPMIVSTSPTDGASNVAGDTPITITANQPLGNITTQTTQILVDGTTSLPYTTTQNGNDTILQAATLLPGGHTITVTLNGVVGEVTQAPLPKYMFSFTTLDQEAPMVFSSTPGNGDTNVAINSAIVVTFTEPVSNVDATSFTVSGATGTISSNADGTVWTFTPIGLLAPGTVYTVTLSSAITDRATTPNHLTTTTFSFTTA